MLSTTHNRAYTDFLTLLTNFGSLVVDSHEQINCSLVKQEFQHLQQCFQEHIVDLDSKDIRSDLVPRWQSIQTEIKREFKLLTTDILFLASARQNTTQTKRRKSIGDRTTKLIGYCRILLNQEG